MAAYFGIFSLLRLCTACVTKEKYFQAMHLDHTFTPIYYLHQFIIISGLHYTWLWLASSFSPLCAYQWTNHGLFVSFLIFLLCTNVHL